MRRVLNNILILKLTLAPILILFASFVRKRWGPVLSGWLISLPLTSAPVIFILALERGEVFAAESSIGVILGLISQSAFSLIYYQLLLRSKLHWFISLPIGWSMFLASTFLLKGVQLTIWSAFLSFTIAFVVVVKKYTRD